MALRPRLRYIAILAGAISAVCAFSVTAVISQDASARASRQVTAGRPIPASALFLCREAHMSCAGHWTRLGGGYAYSLTTRVHLTDAGRIVPNTNSTGCYTSNSSYCTAQNAGTGTCWTSFGHTENGSGIGLWGCDNSSKNQDWNVYMFADSGAYEFSPANASKCMNDPGGRAGDNIQQILWTCSTSATNEFYYPTFPSAHSATFGINDGRNYCLTSNGNSNNGAALETWSCSGDANQTWYSENW
jgi:hypothetical protein